MAQPDRVAVIIGGAGQTGLACARRFVSGNWSVLLVDRDQDRLERAVDEAGDDLVTHLDRLDTRIGVKNALAAGLEAFGRVDALVMVCDPPVAAPMMQIGAEAYDRAIASGGRMALLAVQTFARQFIEQIEEETAGADRTPRGYSITFVTGLEAETSDPDGFLSSVSQSAVLAIVRAASVELARQRVRVNAIIALRPRAETLEARFLKDRTPTGRAALPDEIAEAALYLASPGAASTVGTVLRLDGGRQRLNGVMPRDD